MELRVPRPVLGVMLIFLVPVVLLFVGATTVGVTWDEKTHVLMLDTFFAQGWNVTPDALLPGGTPDPAYIWGVYVYGPVGELFAHAVAVLAGQETLASVSFESGAYAARHVGVAILALLGAAAAGLTVRIVTRSWAFGVTGVTLLMVTPLWVGQGMFNVKDIPVASGMAVATLGIVLLLSDAGRRGVVLGTLALSAGAVLAAGTRAAIGVPIAASLLAGFGMWGLLALRGSERTQLREAVRGMVWGLAGLVLAYGLLVLIYPNAFANPFVLAWEALVVSARFPFDEPVLTAGMWMDQPPPWTYLPLWFGAQLPVLIIVGAVGFTAAWVVMVVRRILGQETVLGNRQLAMITVVVCQMLLMPVVAILFGSNMYNGTRQFLFVVPAAAIVATLGIWTAARWVTERGGSPWKLRALWLVVIVGIVAPVITQVRLFPYNYVGFNAVASAWPISGNWSTDYWRASGRELMERLPPGPESCAYEQSRKGDLHPCSIEPMFVPFLDERGIAAKPGSLEPGEFWMVRENQGITEIPEGCALHDEITRPLWFQEIVIGQVLRCSQGAEPQVLGT